MTVAELTAKLQTMPADLPVIMNVWEPYEEGAEMLEESVDVVAVNDARDAVILK